MQVEDFRSRLATAGFLIKSEGNIPNGTGLALRLANGAIVNVFNNGNVNVQGKNKNRAESDLSFRRTFG
jgi:predicted nucleotide-binding protein